MADIWTRKKRSEVMSRIRGRDTKPEKKVRSLLHGLGFRFTVNGPSNRGLPGRPDIVLPRHGTVVFVHGCFWHAHRGCRHFRVPRTRTAWWKEKFEGNRARDKRVRSALVRDGWNVVVVWECQTMTADKLEELSRSLPAMITGADE